MNTQDLIGKLIPADTKRDAVHIAVAPCVARERLFPGQDIALDGSASGVHIGIVDPFLKGPVFPSQQFFMFLYPNTITSLRHEWTHPALAGIDPCQGGPQASREWVRAYAEGFAYSYEHFMDAAKNYLSDDDYISTGTMQIELDPEFWVHYEMITGEHVPNEKRGSFFTCSC